MIKTVNELNIMFDIITLYSMLIYVQCCLMMDSSLKSTLMLLENGLGWNPNRHLLMCGVNVCFVNEN